MAIKQGKKLTGMEGAIDAQRETTESVDRLNIKFKSFMDSMSRNQLDLLEALREQKEDSTPVTAQPSSAKPSEDSSSSSNGFLGKLLGLGAILTKVAVAVAALETLLRMGGAGTNKIMPVDLTTKIGENGPTVNLDTAAIAAARQVAPRLAARTGAGVAGAIAQNTLIEEARVKQAAGAGKNYTINKSGVAISKTTGQALPAAAQAAIKASGTAALANQSKMANIIKGLVQSTSKQTLKAVPFLGAVASAGFALERLFKGDVVGAGLDVGTGLASATGVGAAASVGAVVASIARDAYNSIYGTDERKFPFESDVINDPEGTKNKMVEITGMVAEEMKKAASSAVASEGERQKGANPRRGGARMQTPLGDGGGVQPSATAVATDSLVTTGNSTGASLDAMNMEYAFNNSSAMQPPVVIDASNNVTSSGGGGGGSSVPMMPINPVGNVGSNRDGFYFPQYLSMVS
jgi:hypothetical protein